MKKLFVMVLSGLMAATLSLGCGGGSATKDKDKDKDKTTAPAADKGSTPPATDAPK